MSVVKIISGKKVADQVLSGVAEGVQEFYRENNRPPRLGVILANDTPASAAYVKKKWETCQKIGVDCRVWDQGKRASNPRDLKPVPFVHSRIAAMQDGGDGLDYDGIIVQLPVDRCEDQKTFYDLIPPAKDVDCFHPVNVGRVCQGQTQQGGRGSLLPCTPAAVIEMLRQGGVQTEGQLVTIINNSDIVGKPLAMMLTNCGATVAVCHKLTKTNDLINLTRSSDIVVVAVGVPHFLRLKHIGNKYPTVIDVGINRVDSKIVGDVHPETHDYLHAVSLVPGGCGLVTVSMLVKNTLTAAWNQA